MDRIGAETVRQLSLAVDIRPDEAQLGELAQALDVLLNAVERSDELNLAEHEPTVRFGLSGGAVDAEL
jgi:hypothetical protein